MMKCGVGIYTVAFSTKGRAVFKEARHRGSLLQRA